MSLWYIFIRFVVNYLECGGFCKKPSKSKSKNNGKGTTEDSNIRDNGGEKCCLEALDDDNHWMCDRCKFCYMGKSPKKLAPGEVHATPKKITESAKTQYKSKSQTVPCFSCGHPGGLMKKLEIDRSSSEYIEHVENKNRVTSKNTTRHTPPPSPVSRRTNEKSEAYDFVHLLCALWVPKYSFDSTGGIFISDGDDDSHAKVGFFGRSPFNTAVEKVLLL